MGWRDEHGVKNWDLSKIPALTTLDMAFPARGLSWLPNWRSMAKSLDEALKWQDNEWGRYVQSLFYKGGKLPATPKPGVSDEDAAKALMLVRAALGSFEPSHEHKIAGCAWILAKYFELPKSESEKSG